MAVTMNCIIFFYVPNYELDYRLTRKGNWHGIGGTVDYHCANSGHMELNVDHMTLILLQTIASRERGTGIG
ncbi:hypothetical protein J6590_104484 [Homalodisca vitripennis]|nr:hypothetical protein J6590_104484 [Homalodisca vitripennis]